jgi:2-oxoglutarate ferredoxin oxidoreductase subunit alpha
MRVSSLHRIKIAGEAGDGIISAGEILMRTAVRTGYYASVVKTFPSNIRGGYSQSLVTIANEPIVTPVDDGDIVLVLSQDAFLRDTQHIDDPDVVVLVESNILNTDTCRSRHADLVATGIKIIALPLRECACEAGVSGAARSTVALGILCQLLGIDEDPACTVLRERHGDKGAGVVELNRIAFSSGFSWAQKRRSDFPCLQLDKRSLLKPELPLILDGNQAVALGALQAGCTFYASYPITPATSIGEALAVYMDRSGGCTYQAEDEIAALGAVIGASFSGVKAMTATSGPGLSLMQECIGYASMAELPAVIVDVQRAGPSTGMPTKHSQDDLSAAVYGGHGEGPRIIIAPLTVEDCFHATVAAFNCAERYQCPVLLLSDATLGVTKTVVEKTALTAHEVINRQIPAGTAEASPQRLRTKRFSRYALSGSCVNPLPAPGDPLHAYCATGVEHDGDGGPVGNPEMRCRQMERRFHKLVTIETEFDLPVEWDLEPAASRYDAAVCAWGFTAAATRAAITMLRGDGLHIAVLYPRLLFPVCKQAVARWCAFASCRIVVEANYTGQYGALIKTVAPVDTLSLTAYRGEPFTPREISEGIIRLLGRRTDRI